MFQLSPWHPLFRARCLPWAHTWAKQRYPPLPLAPKAACLMAIPVSRIRISSRSRTATATVVDRIEVPDFIGLIEALAPKVGPKTSRGAVVFGSFRTPGPEELKELHLASAARNRGKSYVGDCRWGYRADRFLQFLHVVAVDYDEAPDRARELINWPFEVLLFPSSSWHPDNAPHKWRALIPLTRPINSISEYSALKTHLKPILPMGAKLYGASQPMYLSSHPAELLSAAEDSWVYLRGEKYPTLTPPEAVPAYQLPVPQTLVQWSQRRSDLDAKLIDLLGACLYAHARRGGELHTLHDEWFALARGLLNEGVETGRARRIYDEVLQRAEPGEGHRAERAWQRAEQDSYAPGWDVLYDRASSDAMLDTVYVCEALCLRMTHAESVTVEGEDEPEPSTFPLNRPDGSEYPSGEVEREAVQLMLEHPDVCTRGGQLVYIRARTAHLLGADMLNQYLGPRGASVIEYVYDKKTESCVSRQLRYGVPKHVARSIATTSHDDKPLAAVVCHPTLSRITKGYDTETGMYHVMDHSLPRLTVDEAHAVFRDMLGDFPFSEPRHYAAALALCLTLIARPTLFARSATTPGFIVGAGDGGAGKSLLVALCTALTGRPSQRITPKRREELAKELDGVLLTAPNVVHFANVRTGSVLDFPKLDDMLTAERDITFRILGKTETRTVPWCATFIADGNNVRFAGETARRIICVELEKHPDRTYRRTDRELRDWVDSMLPTLQSAALTLLCSTRADTPSIPTFGQWTEWIGGIVKKLTGEDIIECLGSRESIDEADDLGGILEKLYRLGANSPQNKVSAREPAPLYAEVLMRLAQLQYPMAEIRDAHIPQACGAYRNKPSGGYVLRRGRDMLSAGWYVEKLASPQPSV
jgi:hypothetical protein